MVASSERPRQRLAELSEPARQRGAAERIPLGPFARSASGSFRSHQASFPLMLASHRAYFKPSPTLPIERVLLYPALEGELKRLELFGPTRRSVRYLHLRPTGHGSAAQAVLWFENQMSGYLLPILALRLEGIELASFASDAYPSHVSVPSRDAYRTLTGGQTLTLKGSPVPLTRSPRRKAARRSLSSKVQDLNPAASRTASITTTPPPAPHKPDDTHRHGGQRHVLDDLCVLLHQRPLRPQYPTRANKRPLP